MATFSFPITYATHSYQIRYDDPSSPSSHQLLSDGVFITTVVSNFVLTSRVLCGGETYSGVEAIGNTYCVTLIVGLIKKRKRTPH